MNSYSKKIASVEDSLDQFFSAESVNDYCCVKCTLLNAKKSLVSNALFNLNTRLDLFFDELLKQTHELTGSFLFINS